MDLGVAQTLAATSGTGDLATLAKAAGNPAASRGAAQQFGALLMQNLLRQADGTALPMAGGTGSDVVNQMFSSTIAHAAMAHEKMGLTDMILKSMQTKQQQVDGQTGAPTAAAAPKQATTGAALPLAAYWANNGMRPLAAAMAQGRAAPGTAAMALMTHINPKLAKAFGFSGGAEAGVGQAGGATTFESKPGHASGGASAEEMAAFAQKLMPLLQEAGQQLGVSPKILLAQTAIETGWGRAVVGNNLFGIKAGSSWSGAKVETATHEYQNGELISIVDAFRAYPSAQASVHDFVSMVANSPRYRGALGAGDNAVSYAQGLLAGGWATDINYVSKLHSVAASSALAAATASAPAPQPPAVSAMPRASAAAPQPAAAPVEPMPDQPVSLLPASFAVPR